MKLQHEELLLMQETESLGKSWAMRSPPPTRSRTNSKSPARSTSARLFADNQAGHEDVTPFLTEVEGEPEDGHTHQPNPEGTICLACNRPLIAGKGLGR